MNNQHRTTTCRWATLTLSLPYPAWLAAEDYPWSCVRTGAAVPLETTDVCASCEHWEAGSIAQLTAARPSSRQVIE